jgi:hypothetical protein
MARFTNSTSKTAIIKKMTRYNALGSFFLALLGSVVVFCAAPVAARAAAPFNDNFDTYTAEQNLSGQGGWSCIAGSALVKNTASQTAPNSVLPSSAACYRRNGTSLADGTVYFYVKTDSHSSGWGSFSIIKATEQTSYAVVAWSTANGTLTENYTGTSNWGTLQSGWNLIGIKWHYEANAANDVFQVSLNGSDFADGSSSFQTYLHSGAILTGAITGYSFGNAQGDYFDSITGTPPVPPVITGYEPILTATHPVSGQTNQVTMSAVVESGTIEIPTNNPNTYNDFVITYRAVNSLFPAYEDHIALPNLAAGQTYAYSNTVDIPVSGTGTNWFKVSYSISGSSWFSSPLEWTVDTWITDTSTTTPPNGIINPAALPPAASLVDCSGKTGVDLGVCQVENWLIGAFLPSQAAMDQFSNTMNAFKTKFPINYINTISTTFSAIYNGIDENAGLTIQILNVSHTINTSFFTTTLPGQTFSLGGAIKIFLTFLLIAVFLIWGMGYMHRIFPA